MIVHTSQFEVENYNCIGANIQKTRKSASNPCMWSSELRLKNDNCIGANIQNVKCLRPIHACGVRSCGSKMTIV